MRRSPFFAWLMAGDIAAVTAAYLLAYIIRFHLGLFETAPGSVPTLSQYAKLLPAVAILWPFMYDLQRLYRPLRTHSLSEELLPICAGSVLAAAVLFGADAYYRLYHFASNLTPIAEQFQYSRKFIAIFLALGVPLTIGARFAVRRWAARRRRHGLNVKRVLVLGAGDLGRGIARELMGRADYGCHVVGFADDEPTKKGKRFEGVPVLGTTDDVMGLVAQERVDELIVALPWRAHDQMIRILDEAANECLDVRVVPDLLQFIAARTTLEDLGGVPLLDLSEAPLRAWDRALKRGFDIVATGLGLIVLAVPLAIVALLVKRSSPGPVLYRQQRVGLDGTEFVMAKFRTMYTDAEASTGPVFATDEDPRATPLGRFLRRWSIDELPQLWNVLTGEMSLVGPRPERPSFVTEFKTKIPSYMLRHRMKSGITGWAQVHGWRGRTSIEKRIEHDLYYLRNWSLGLDIRIIWMTLAGGLRAGRAARTQQLR